MCFKPLFLGHLSFYFSSRLVIFCLEGIWGWRTLEWERQACDATRCLGGQYFGVLDLIALYFIEGSFLCDLLANDLDGIR